MGGAADGVKTALAGAVDGGAAPASRWLRWRPPRIAQGLTVAALAAHALVWGVDAPWGRSLPAGLVLIAVGLGWTLWAVGCFRAARTPIRPSDGPQRLVDHGPFRFGRNPMYLGIATAMLGLGVALGVPSMALAAGGFAAVMQRVHIPHEERQLRRAFGGWYSDYAASVRRWL
jgi:protein-S-isoprenylcysteine O-methyltransferase Ste14